MGKGGALFDKTCVHVVEVMHARGADVSCTDEDNWTTMMNAARHGYWKTFCKLAELGSDVDGQASDNGDGILHLAIDPLQQIKMICRRVVFDTTPVPTVEYVKLLLSNRRLDPCLLNFRGQTAYMAAASPKHVAALRPEPSWEVVEEILLARDVVKDAHLSPADSIANALVKQVGAEVKQLRLHDMLFCKHEGNEQELLRRRYLLFDCFLGPFTLEVCTVRVLKKAEKDMLMCVMLDRSHRTAHLRRIDLPTHPAALPERPPD